MSGEEEQKQEMLIIRRNSGDDLMAVKGGAWKIAYADFVTAMMAFFLVMWLINSANEVTKARVASYFNPIKMTDASPAKRGLMEEVSTTSPKNNVESRESTAGQGKGPGEADKAGGELKIAEHSMMLNPVSSLDAIIRHAKQESVSTGQADAMAPVGDPFDPRSYEQLSDEPSQTSDGKAELGTRKEKHGPSSVPALKVLPTPAPPHLTKTEPKASPEKKHPFGTEEEKKFVEKLQVEIGRKVDSLGAKIDIKVQVKVTGEGVLIILEDGRGRSMFAVGSAQPNPALIEILEEVGSLLSGRPEDVIIRGHTDARQFRNKTYDNWQLSTARAHMASYMLMRGGLPERRLKKVEGFGSSSPIDPENTMADSNRRVEFLLAHKG